MNTPTRRGLFAGPLVAVLTLVAALICTNAAGVTFRDPDHVAVGYIFEVGAGVALLVLLDIALRAGRRTGTWRPAKAAMRAVRRERWTPARSIAVATGIVSFYVTYLAYRNLKAVVPLLRPQLFDRQLENADRWLLFGHDPAVVLHDLLGMGFQTQVLSTVYAAFIVFLPLSLGLALVFSRRIELSLFYATTLSINWVLGAASYFLLPSLGPAYAQPWLFAALPHSEVTNLQKMLLDQRVGFLHDPATGTPQAIAAFASLHLAMSATALVVAHLVGLGRRIKMALWTWVALTFLATIYLGWHYVLDDVAGVAIAFMALGLARLVTGFDPRAVRRRRAAGTPAPSAAQPQGATAGG